MEQLIIIGAGGHGKVIADIAVKNGYEKIVFLDDNELLKECMGYPIIGKIKDAFKIKGKKIVAIGDSKIRESIQKEIDTIILIHPNAIIGSGVRIGTGTVIMPGAIINPDTTIGKGCIINTSSSIDHDCLIGDFAHIAVGAHLCGNVHIGNNTWVGAGAIVNNNIDICDDCMIGSGGVVVKDINVSGVYIGVPAKLNMV